MTLTYVGQGFSPAGEQYVEQGLPPSLKLRRTADALAEAV
jgi:hypothetical protein